MTLAVSGQQLTGHGEDILCVKYEPDYLLGIMKALIGSAVLVILVIAACLLFIVGGPRPADPEGLRAPAGLQGRSGQSLQQVR